MATAADPNRKTNDAPATGSKRRNLLLPALLLSLIAATAAGAGVWYYTQLHAAPAGPQPAPPPAPALYVAVDPAFVVNLPFSYDGPRYLQVEVQLMTRDPVALEKIRANLPAIRARLLMFFAQTDPSLIGDRAGHYLELVAGTVQRVVNGVIGAAANRARSPSPARTYRRRCASASRRRSRKARPSCAPTVSRATSNC